MTVDRSSWFLGTVCPECGDKLATDGRMVWCCGKPTEHKQITFYRYVEENP